MFTLCECLVLGYLQFGTPSNFQGLSLIFDNKAKWDEVCASSHAGCESWMIQRGDLRIVFLFKLLLFIDIVKTIAQTD